MSTADSADTRTERPETLKQRLRREMGDDALDDAYVQLAIDALGLDPDTVLDGPLVVLHPRHKVVRPHELNDEWVVIASGPEEEK